MMKIMANRMDRGFFRYQKEFEDKALEVLRSGWYVLGNEVKSFEEEFAAYTGGNYCVGLASGLDALWIAFRLLGIGPGDEVIVQGNTYIASVMGITINGATPIFVEPDAYYNIDASKIEEKITERTKAVLVVHLYGQASNMAAVKALTDKYHLKLVEDCAQSHGACFDGQMTGTFGDVGCFSFYPSKNIGAFGDGGGVVVKDEGLAQDFRVFRNYGSEKRYYNKVVGANSRLDELQAGLLRVRLRHVQECEEERCQIAARYLQEIRNPKLTLPGVREERIYQLCLDAKGKLLACRLLGDGTVDAVSFSARRVLENAIQTRASLVALGHNHPSGVAIPSQEDIAATRSVADALRAVDIPLVDHVVVADNDFVSMADSGLTW